MSAPTSPGNLPETGLVRRLRKARSARAGDEPFIVAYSGGPDSTALLHALTWLRDRDGAPVRAWHVNHQLDPQANAWESHCRSVCDALGVEISVFRVDARATRDESPEEAARRARYAALGRALGPESVLCTAHHREDQVETVLLGLIRGGGVHALAGMRERRPLGAGTLWRPLLDAPRAEILDHLGSARVAVLDDPANRDPTLARTVLRTSVLPALRAHWPGADRALARAARLGGESANLLDALAEIDLDALQSVPGRALSCAALAGLPVPRARNALRRWFRLRKLDPPRAVHLDAILDSVLSAGADRSPRVAWRGVEVRRYRDHLFASPPLAPVPHGLECSWESPRDRPLALPHGTLALLPAIGEGIGASVADLRDWRIGFRRGGERIALPGRQGRHTLKALFQARGVPPWERDRLPLLYVGGRLAAVADLWVDAAVAAAPSAAGLALSWRPDRPADFS